MCVCRSVLERTWLIARAHARTHTHTHTHTYTHTHTQVIKVTDEAIICPGCKHKSMMPGLSLSALDEINRKRDLIFEQRGGNDDVGESAAKRRRRNEIPLSLPFLCQCATQALVNLRQPNFDECFNSEIRMGLNLNLGIKDVLGKKCASTDPLSDFYPIRFLN